MQKPLSRLTLPLLCTCRLSLAERQMVDNCGESLVTDHGAFVLVNMHLQCVGSKWDGPEKGQEDKYEVSKKPTMQACTCFSRGHGAAPLLVHDTGLCQ